MPPGTYRIDGTLILGKKTHLHLSSGAWLKRLSAYTQNTKPLVRITGHYAALTGDGQNCGVTTENSSGGNTGNDIINNGVVNVGPSNTTDVFNILFWNISSIVINGSISDWKNYTISPYTDKCDLNELLTIVCGQGLSNKKGATYCGYIDNVLFQYGGTAIKLNAISNGNIFTNNRFYRLTNNIIEIVKCTENVFTNAFVHASPGVTCLKLENADYNHFYGLMAEPGPNTPNRRLTRFCNIDAQSMQNVIFGHGNTGHASIVKNRDNLICDHGYIEIASLATNKLHADSINASSLNLSQPDSSPVTETQSAIEKIFTTTFSAQQATDFQPIAKCVVNAPNQVYLIELMVVIQGQKSSDSSAASYIISGNTNAKNFVTASVSLMAGNSSIECKADIKNNEITLKLKTPQNISNNCIIYIRVNNNKNLSISKT